MVRVRLVGHGERRPSKTRLGLGLGLGLGAAMAPRPPYSGAVDGWRLWA